MSKVITALANLAIKLDNANLKKVADVLDSVNTNVLKIVQAQYEGVQGYWVRNQRCWSNCYRQKRESTKKSAQEVWFDCQKEYEESLGKDESSWDKYANELPNLIKTASVRVQKRATAEQNRFHTGLWKKIAEGLDFPSAVFETIEDRNHEISNALLLQANKVASVSALLKKQGKIELAKESAKIAIYLVKKASTEFNDNQFKKKAATEFGAWSDEANDDTVGGVAKQFFGGAKNLWNTIKGNTKKLISDRVNKIIGAIDQVGQNFTDESFKTLYNRILTETKNLAMEANKIQDQSSKKSAYNFVNSINQSLQSFTTNTAPGQIGQRRNQLFKLRQNLISMLSGIQSQPAAPQGNANPYSQPAVQQRQPGSQQRVQPQNGRAPSAHREMFKALNDAMNKKDWQKAIDLGEEMMKHFGNNVSPLLQKQLQKAHYFKDKIPQQDPSQVSPSPQVNQPDPSQVSPSPQVNQPDPQAAQAAPQQIDKDEIRRSVNQNIKQKNWPEVKKLCEIFLNAVKGDPAQQKNLEDCQKWLDFAEKEIAKTTAVPQTEVRKPTKIEQISTDTVGQYISAIKTNFNDQNWEKVKELCSDFIHEYKDYFKYKNLVAEAQKLLEKANALIATQPQPSSTPPTTGNDEQTRDAVISFANKNKAEVNAKLAALNSPYRLVEDQQKAIAFVKPFNLRKVAQQASYNIDASFVADYLVQHYFSKPNPIEDLKKIGIAIYKVDPANKAPVAPVGQNPPVSSTAPQTAPGTSPTSTAPSGIVPPKDKKPPKQNPYMPPAMTEENLLKLPPPKNNKQKEQHIKALGALFRDAIASGNQERTKSIGNLINTIYGKMADGIKDRESVQKLFAETGFTPDPAKTTPITNPALPTAKAPDPQVAKPPANIPPTPKEQKTPTGDEKVTDLTDINKPNGTVDTGVAPQAPAQVPSIEAPATSVLPQSTQKINPESLNAFYDALKENGFKEEDIASLSKYLKEDKGYDDASINDGIQELKQRYKEENNKEIDGFLDKGGTPPTYSAPQTELEQQPETNPAAQKTAPDPSVIDRPTIVMPTSSPEDVQKAEEVRKKVQRLKASKFDHNEHTRDTIVNFLDSIERGGGSQISKQDVDDISKFLGTGSYPSIQNLFDKYTNVANENVIPEKAPNTPQSTGSTAPVGTLPVQGNQKPKSKIEEETEQQFQKQFGKPVEDASPQEALDFMTREGNYAGHPVLFEKAKQAQQQGLVAKSPTSSKPEQKTEIAPQEHKHTQVANFDKKQVEDMIRHLTESESNNQAMFAKPTSRQDGQTRYDKDASDSVKKFLESMQTGNPIFPVYMTGVKKYITTPNSNRGQENFKTKLKQWVKEYEDLLTKKPQQQTGSAPNGFTTSPNLASNIRPKIIRLSSLESGAQRLMHKIKKGFLVK